MSARTKYAWQGGQNFRLLHLTNTWNFSSKITVRQIHSTLSDFFSFEIYICRKPSYRKSPGVFSSWQVRKRVGIRNISKERETVKFISAKRERPLCPPHFKLTTSSATITWTFLTFCSITMTKWKDPEAPRTLPNSKPKFKNMLKSLGFSPKRRQT